MIIAEEKVRPGMLNIPSQPKVVTVKRAERTEAEVEGRAYVAYGPYVDHKEAKLLGKSLDRCTVAVRKVGNKFIYGISICAPDNVFSKATGREYAIDRLNSGLWSFDAEYYPIFEESWEKAILRFLSTMVEKVTENPKRFKRKICRDCN